MAALYELTADLRELYDMLTDPECRNALEAIENTIELNREDYTEKADAYAKLIRSLLADADKLKQEEERLAARRKSFERNAEDLKERLQKSMQVLGYQKFKTLFFTFSIQKNPPSVQADDRLVPEKYLIPQAPKINRQALMDDLKTGAEILGASLVQTESLRIR